jgi:hypothetical protein
MKLVSEIAKSLYYQGNDANPYGMVDNVKFTMMALNDFRIIC